MKHLTPKAIEARERKLEQNRIHSRKRRALGLDKSMKKDAHEGFPTDLLKIVLYTKRSI